MPISNIEHTIYKSSLDASKRAQQTNLRIYMEANGLLIEV